MITRRRFTAGTLAVGLAGRAKAQERPPLLFFAAASLQGALNAIAVQWARETGKRVVFSYAASSALARQLEQGAPADLFASADLEWMAEVEKKGLVAPETRHNLLGNTLVLVAAKDDAARLALAPGLDLAGALGEGRLATGNPASVPVGRYAQAALTSLGLWERVAPKIAGADNARAALALVARGEAKFGIVYATDAKSEPKVRVVDTFPASSYPRIVYPFAQVKTSTNPDAPAFLAYLRSPAARLVFEGEGFTVLP